MSGSQSYKQRIQSGDHITGTTISLDATSGELEDLATRYDFFNIDSQHSPFDERKLATVCGMAEEIQKPVHFRIPHTAHTYLIGRYLDLGPTVIVVPEVKELQTVNEAVKFFYYPQKGKRSWGGDARCGIKTCPDRLEYAQWWNENGILSIQIESVDAVVNCQHLARPGVDMVTFGANDLSFDLESYQIPPFESVDKCIKHVVDTLEGTGVAVSIGVHNSGERDKYLEMGIKVLLEP